MADQEAAQPATATAGPGGVTETLEAAPASCAECGRAAPPSGVPITWIGSRERGRLEHTCDACARTHLRSIEGRLDRAWW